MIGKTRRKIAFIHPDLGIGGAERLVIDMANSLSDENDIIFITNHFDANHCFDDVRDKYEIQVFGDWIPRSFLGRFQALFAYLRMVYLIVTYLLFFRKDIDLYIVDLIPIAIPFLKLARQSVIYYCHHPDLLATTRSGIMKKLYRKPIDYTEYKATATADVILVNSEYTASIFKETFPQIERQLQVLYPTISSSFVTHLSTVKTERTIWEDRFVFLSVNRFHPAKKIELLVEATAHLKTLLSEKTWANISVILIGGYDPINLTNKLYFESIEELCTQLKLNSTITTIKSPSETTKAQFIKLCKCLIYTPIKEHFGIVPLEAMAAEKPVIACNSGGPKETVKHGYNGYLCEPNATSLAEYMKKIIQDQNSEELGRNGKKQLEKEFSNEIFTARLKTIVAKNLLQRY